MWKSALWVIAGIFTLMLAANQAGAVTVYYDFSSGMGPDFTFKKLNTDAVYLDDSGGELRIWSDGMSGSGVRMGQVLSNFRIIGDFDITADFDIKIPLLEKQQVELHPYNSSGNFFVIRSNESGIGGNNYHVYDGSVKGVVLTTDLTGTLRVKRVGSQFYSSFWNGTSYQELFNEFIGTGQITFGMAVQNNSFQQGAFSVAYDDLWITADNIIFPAPMPSSLLLFGPGLIGLTALMYRRRS